MSDIPTDVGTAGDPRHVFWLPAYPSFSLPFMTNVDVKTSYPVTAARPRPSFTALPFDRVLTDSESQHRI